MTSKRKFVHPTTARRNADLQFADLDPDCRALADAIAWQIAKDRGYSAAIEAMSEAESVVRLSLERGE